MYYSQLNASQKTSITKLLNAKKRLEEAKKRYEVEVEKTLPLVKEVEGIQKDFSKISYIPASDYTTLDAQKLKKEAPELYQKYSKEARRKESLRVAL